MAVAEPSELEGVVLGIVWKFGPCTPHAIRTHFVSSRNRRFSASAGAIYPLVRRLEARGLLRSRLDRTTRQARRLYEVSPAGRRRLRGWLAPAREADHGALHDPLRSRVYFLGALGRGRRAAFLATAEAGLNRTLALLRADLRRHREDGATLSTIATRGAIAVTRTQLRWLRAIRREVIEAGAGRPARRPPRRRRPARRTPADR